MTCPCGIPLDACERERDLDDCTDGHDERLASLCPCCKEHVTADVSELGARIRCTCGVTLVVRMHELAMVYSEESERSAA